MNKQFVLVCIFLGSVVSAFGQTDKPYIEVTGSAEAEIDPNIIVLSVLLQEYNENKVKVTMGKIEADFNAAVAKSGIPKENVRLADFSANAFQPRKMDRDSYVRKTFEVTFSKSSDVLNFLSNLKSVAIESVRVTKLSHTEIQKFRLETKVAALKAAEMKADALLSAVNSRRGKAIVIEERPDLPEQYSINLEGNTMAYYSTLPAARSEDGDNVSLKKIHLRFEIMARFGID